MRWHSIFSKYTIIAFNKFIYRRKQLLTQTLAVVSFVNSDTIVIYKKSYGCTISLNPSTYHNIFGYLVCWINKFSSGISDLFPLPYTRSFCRLKKKSIFYQNHVETVLGQPEPCLLSIEPVSLYFFNRNLVEEYFRILDGWFLQSL